MHWRIEPTNLGEVLACAGIARLAWRHDAQAATGFDGNRFTAPDDALGGLVPGLEVAEGGLRLCGFDIDWWQPWGLNPVLKHWSGQQTPTTVHGHSVERAAEADPADWRTFSAGAKGQLYVDTRTMWEPQGMGWSLNEHQEFRISARPWLDLLASLGLQAFRVAGSRAAGFDYHLWCPAPLPVAAAAFAGHGAGTYSERGFRAATGKSGKLTYLLPAHPL